MESSSSLSPEVKKGELPKSRKDFGYNFDQVIEKVLSRVEQKYPKKKVERLLLEGRSKEAHRVWAKAFGKFLAEIDYVAYAPPRSLNTPVNEKQLALNRERSWKKDCYPNAFTDAYGIDISNTDLLKIREFLRIADGNMENPQLISRFNFLMGRKSCPLPAYTTWMLLGKEMKELPPIPAQYEVERHIDPRVGETLILKRKKQIEYRTQLQIKEEGEPVDQAQGSTSKDDKEGVDPMKVAAKVAGTGAGVSFGLSAIARGLAETAEEIDQLCKKTSAFFAVVGGGLLAGAAFTLSMSKLGASKPSTKIKTTCLLDKKYILDKETFLGQRILIVDGKESFDRDVLTEYEEDRGRFFDLKSIIDGTHPKLAEVLKNKEQRELYTATARSFMESQYQMMCEFPDIIEEARGYDEAVHERIDKIGIVGVKAEFVRY